MYSTHLKVINIFSHGRANGETSRRYFRFKVLKLLDLKKRCIL